VTEPAHGPEAEPQSFTKVSVGRQVLRRELNDRIRMRPNSGSDLEVFCECGRAGCRENTRIERELYETLRKVPVHFLVKRAHADPSDRVVDSAGDFLVVEKSGDEEFEVMKLDRGKQHLHSEAP